MKYIKDRFPIVVVLIILLCGYGFLVWNYQKNHNSKTGDENGQVEQPVDNIYLPDFSGYVERTTSDDIQGDTQNKKSIKAPIQNSSELQRRDHLAQIHMSWAAWVGLLLGLLGTVLIGITLFYTRQTLTAAKSANEAAWKAVDDTRELGEKQSCAYITVRKVIWGFSDSHAMCEITIENVGNSPCVQGRISARVQAENTLVTPFGGNTEQREFFGPDDSAKFGVIQTNGTLILTFNWFGGHYMKPDKWFDLCTSDIGGDSRILMEIEWEDVFGKLHTFKLDAHRHHDFKVNWEKSEIFHERLGISKHQQYKRNE